MSWRWLSWIPGPVVVSALVLWRLSWPAPQGAGLPDEDWRKTPAGIDARLTEVQPAQVVLGNSIAGFAV
jgi:hypothetical protein